MFAVAVRAMTLSWWVQLKELEQIKQYNARLTNRMEWKLQNPYG